MIINLIEVPTPMMSEFEMFANPNVELLKEKKTVRISVRQKTKTRISTSMTIGKSCVRINFPIEGFKTFEESSYSMLTYSNTTSNYFVKSTKQNLSVYKEYIKKLVEHVVKDILNVELDELTIELEAKGF